MNRNTIIAVLASLMIGVWGGMVLARPGGGVSGPAPVTAAGGEVMRAAGAVRPDASAYDVMAFLRLRFDTSGADAKACLEFTKPLSQDAGVDYRDYLAIEPAAPYAVEAVGTLLCLAGLPFEPERQVTIRAGLPAADGLKTETDESFALSFGERPPFIGFAGTGVILPRTEADGLGIETVNIVKLGIEVYRVGDRALNRATIDQGASIAEGSWNWWDFEGAGENQGVKVYEGEIDIPETDPATKLSRRNTAVTTVFALGAALKTFKPGAYVVKLRDASPSAGARGQNNDRPAAAHRWILYTDIALQSFSGAHGLDVVARSLQTAKAMPGVRLALIADNNEILAESNTDAQGRGRFPAPALAGEGGMRPRYVLAYGDRGDFTALDLERPGLDLSDRDVAGRSAPGAIDAYVYTDRGIYRPGETVRLTGLIRDGGGRAVTDRQSVLVVYRPNGTEARRSRLERAAEAGAILKNIEIDRAAPRGQWRAVLEVDGQEAPAGEVAFAVEDFVPQRLKVEAETTETPLTRNETRPINVVARFLYGAPGSGLSVEGEARLGVDPNPFPKYPGYQFGRVDESFDEQFLQLSSAVTDGDGRASLGLSVAEAPQSTLPLSAQVTASVFEPGGRTVREGFRIPVRLTDRYLGLKPKFEGGAPEGGRAAFDLVALDPAGRPVSVSGLSWTLVEEDWWYDWYLEGGEWRWRRTGRDIPVAAGKISAAAAGPVEIAQEKINPGGYRLIVEDGAGAATSLRFYAGWGWDAGDREAPDVVAIAAPVEPAKAGGRAKLRIKAPYAGEAQVVIATDRVLEMRSLRVGPDGADLDLRMDPAWGAGVYVLVTVMTPRDPGSLPQPRRAVGAAYVPVDMGARTLKVTLPEGQVLRPRTTVEVPIKIAGAPRGEKVRVTLAAVDEGILQLTKHQSPDPAAYIFGKRALGVDIRDDYGRLLNPNLGAPAIARQGGDSLGGEGLTTVPTKTVALWSGLVAIGRDGAAAIPLVLPDFNGELRLMAVAWSETALGAGAAPATIRDPVVAEVTLPRFLAPGDQSAATLELANVEGQAGAYQVRVETSGAAQSAGFSQSFTLAKGAQTRARIPLNAAIAGLGEVRLSVQGPGGFTVARSYQIEARSPYLPVMRAETQSFPAGASYRIPAEALAGFAPGQAQAVASFSALQGIDASPLLDSLDRYPYGCTEQIVSRAGPLLYANALAAAAQEAGDPRLRRRVQEAVNKVLDRQGSDGAFGLWRAQDAAASPWLGAYATDFLRRAKAAGYVVPDAPLQSAYQALRAVARLDDFAPVAYQFEVFQYPGATDTTALLRARAAAYSLYVLAKAGKADIGQVRYAFDAQLKAEPNPLARAHIAAALAHLGDQARAARAFKAAEDALGHQNPSDYYQTPQRDLAGVLALAAEAGQTPLVDRLAARLARQGRDPALMTTQEQAFTLFAADALLKRAGAPKITLAGAPVVGPVAADAARIAAGVVFANAGQGTVFRTLTVSGRPAGAPPAASEGFTIAKRLFSLTGANLDGANLRQGDRVVVAISGAADGQRLHPAVIVDLLPAGLEIEQVLTPADGAGYGPESRGGAFAWLGQISQGRVTEARDDRFVAAEDLYDQTFRFAYVARAVTPGRYALPAAQVEDMYRPGLFARTGVGAVTIAPADGG